jgi:menaquinone-dependent protoporphyrinogen oxidase
MAEILILYSTTDGHTRTICRRLEEVVEEQGHGVTVMSLDEEPDADLAPFDKVVIGASIRYGKHSKQVYRFIRSHQDDLDRKPNAFFSVNVVARKPGKDTPETNPYLQKFLKQIAWRPKELAVFAGKIDYPQYRWWDRLIIRAIMWITRGPTDPEAVVEFTDWKQVEAFGRRIGKM